MYRHIKKQHKNIDSNLQFTFYNHVYRITANYLYKSMSLTKNGSEVTSSVYPNSKMNITNANKTVLQHYSNNQAKKLGHMWKDN